MEAHFPALCRWLQQRDGYQLGEPRPGCAIAVSRDEELSVLRKRVADLIAKLAIPIPNEHTERIEQKARELGVYIQTGSMLETDSKWPGRVFNTTCLIGPEGMLYKYRKVNTWIPYEVHSSPHDL